MIIWIKRVQYMICSTELSGIFISRSEHAAHHAYKEYFSHIYFFDAYMHKETMTHDMFHRAQWKKTRMVCHIS